jgi:hypothetical protein
MGNYRILLGPINTGAAVHEDGGTISMAAVEAAPMVELGIIELIPAKPQRAAKPAP